MSESAPGQGDAGMSSTGENKDSSVQCPTCDRDDFDSNRGMRMHHARTHGESLSFSTYECAECGTTFERQDTKVDSENVFCGRDCFAAYDSRAKSGEDHRWYQGGKQVVAYSFCGDALKRDKHEVEKSTEFFCNIGCQAAWKQQSDNWSSDTHPAWKGGGGVEYGPEWERISQSIRERDGYQCRSCGMSQAEHQREFNKSLHVHHVVPVRSFSNTEDAHSLENLVTACIPCHRKFEGLPVFPR